MTKHRDFESAREFVRALNLKRNQEWFEYCKSGNKPDDIPASPNYTYKKDWKGIADWLGSGVISNCNKVYRPFTEAREFVRALNLKRNQEWFEYCKSGNKPDDITASPNSTYKKDWKGIADWLGYESEIHKKNFRDFESAREFARALNLKGTKEWYEYCKSGNKPDDIPSNAHKNYENKGWVSYGDFLGTGNIASHDKVYRSFKEAREFARSLGLKNSKEWFEYCTSGNKPDDIPSAPWKKYKEWKKK
jgi:hypothetical protein